MKLSKKEAELYGSYNIRYLDGAIQAAYDATPAALTQGAFWTALAARLGRTYWGVKSAACRRGFVAKVKSRTVQLHKCPVCGQRKLLVLEHNRCILCAEEAP